VEGSQGSELLGWMENSGSRRCREAGTR